MDTFNLVEKTAVLRSINDNNAKNLLKLGIDMSALPSNIQSTIKDYVATQRMTGLHDLDLTNLELWHLNKKDEILGLEQDIVKPLQRKVDQIVGEIEKVDKKIVALSESIDDFEAAMISDGDFDSRCHEIGSVIAEAEKAITKTPLPPVQLDCDNLINQVNKLNIERKLKAKNNMKKY